MVVVGVFAISALVAEGKKPNIVLLYIDDWAWNGSSVAMASGGRMASAAPTTTAAPPAPSAGRMGGAAPATTNGKNQPSLSLSKIKYQEQKQQRDEYVKKEVEKITKQYGFQSGARHTMETMKRYSDYFKARYFIEPFQ